MDLVTPSFRVASTVAQSVPGGLVDLAAPRLAGLLALRSSERRAMVERHQRRVDPGLSGVALRRRVQQVYASYGRYYGESFRLPSVGPDELDARLTYEGLEHVERAIDKGIGPLLCLPHLGSWEWSAYWLTRVRDIPVTAVVERIDPPALFDWFVEFREGIGMEIVPLGPEAGRATVAAVKAGRVIALLCDRDIGRGGVEVEFFGERTTLPSGPAVLALRTGAPLLPTAVYDDGPVHHGLVRPPLPAERRGSFRDDVARVTQALAVELEGLIRRAPSQWHLMQPNWPSDHAAGAVRL
ncbi:MAG TPA: phosphatidylinositol mannoside acyltransferase [Acidimicrobiales bacterium]|nr:phosphatidylinositol mannoside acyltransferase [Acidimicrobiales bacterium]